MPTAGAKKDAKDLERSHSDITEQDLGKPTAEDPPPVRLMRLASKIFADRRRSSALM